MTSIFYRFVTSIALFLCVTATWADEIPPSLDEAHRLLKVGQAAQAATLLEKDLLLFAGNADFDYALATAWYESGQTGKALFAFERVLMANPNNIDARLKAASISADHCDVAYSLTLLEPLAIQTLSSVQQQELAKIQARLTQTANTQPLTIRGYVLSAYGWDDNVTSGPDQGTLSIPGLGSTNRGPNVTTLGTSQRDKDTVGSVEAGISLVQAASADTWLTAESNLRQGFNQTRTDVTEGFVNLNLGLLHRTEREYFGAAVLGQSYQVSHLTYRNSLGARLNWTHAFNDNSTLTLYAQQLSFTYPDHVIDNATRRLIGITHETSLTGSEGMLQYGLFGGAESAQDASKPHFSFHIAGASLSASLPLTPSFALAAGAVIETHNHDSTDPLYTVSAQPPPAPPPTSSTRSDVIRSAGLTADYHFSPSWHFLPRYTYVHNASNEALYDYARSTFMLQLKWEFDHGKN